jgi:hypothetical protein
MTGASRMAAYRARKKEAGLPDPSRAWRPSKAQQRLYKKWSSIEKVAEARPFTGCDGEGCGTDALGRQLYMLFRMGDRELYTGSRLTSDELLDFICDHPAGEILTGFFFSYDVTMILRDLPVSQQKRLFEPRVKRKGFSPFVWYKSFNIDYLPKQYFRVQRVIVTRLPDGTERRETVKGSTRTIYEVFGFFQKTFLKSCKEFGIGSADDRKVVEENKAARAQFETITPEIRDYCAIECKHLSELMEKLRQYCSAAGIMPQTWNGAGKLATSLHKTHGTPTREHLDTFIPQGVFDYASAAYYGGRFEITRTGYIRGKVYEYDINSAYPDAMRALPCLLHGRWVFREQIDDDENLFVAQASFSRVPVSGRMDLSGLPVRTKEGHLFWPLRGAGIYWSCEISSAKKLGARVRLGSGWSYDRQCDCHSFDWVERLYDYRKSIGSQGPGYPIKLGLNSLYGKLAQRIGNGKYANPIWASLITAQTRSKLNDVVSRAKNGSVVMLATDAVYSLEPLDIEMGERLGEFGAETFDDFFIVQPGLYWSPDKRKRKSRGLSGGFFEAPGLTERFEDDFQKWLARTSSGEQLNGGPTGPPLDFPVIPVPVKNFVGMKLAVARGKPETAGVWKDETRQISFDYRAKRFGHSIVDTHIVTGPKPGYEGLTSVSHRDMIESGAYKLLDDMRASFDEAQEYVDLGPPFED